MDGNNKYDAEKFGKQDAKKGIKFIKFPNVLIIQLKRFEYDYKRDQMIKINDHFEFYKELDLNKYTCKQEIDGNEIDNTEFNYTLQSVVVHQGSASRGHYYSYLNPTTNDKNWLLFNDEIVRPANLYEVYDYNFGGIKSCISIKPGGKLVEYYVNSDANAYILVYIKNSVRDEIMKQVLEEDVSNY